MKIISTRKLRRFLTNLRTKCIKSMPDSALRRVLLRKYINELRSIVVIVGQNCTLKCRHCANFSPYLANILPFYDYQEIISDIECLTNECKISHLQLQGGEFFLHPNHLDILEAIIKNNRIFNITIVTNATIIPKVEVLEKIRDSKKITVRMSNYGNVNNTLIEKLESKLKEYSINYFIHKYILGTSQWAKCGDRNMKKMKESLMQKFFDQCVFADYCLTMENGFITRCSRATIAHLVQNFNLAKNDGLLLKNRITLGGGGNICVI